MNSYIDVRNLLGKKHSEINDINDKRPKDVFELDLNLSRDSSLNRARG